MRRLIFDERSVKYRTKVIDNSAFFNMSLTKPTPLGPVLPNLRSIVWHVENPETQFKAITFMHAGVEEYDAVVLPSVHAGIDIDYMWQMGTRMPELIRLTLRRRGPVRELQEHFCRAFERLPKLQKVVLPLCGSTTRVVEALSRLEKLQEVSFTGPDECGMGFLTDVEDFSPVLREGAFPALRRMSFSAHVPAATRFIDSTLFPTNLTRLYVHVVDIVDTDVLQTFFSAVARKCPCLVDLTVDFIISPCAALAIPAPPIETRPHIQTFRTLFTCVRITSFEFRWDYPLSLQDRDMEEFALAWPGLEHFMLNCEAVIEFTPSTLTLGALIPFATFCPRLRHLGLYVDADAAPSTTIDQPFRSLRNLSVGASSITAAEPVSLFLSRLCSPYCAIVSGFRWPDAYSLALDNAGIFDERRANICDYWVRWNEVLKILPVVIRARVEERDRVAFRTLQREDDTPRP